MPGTLYNPPCKQSPDGGWLQYFLIYHEIFSDTSYKILCFGLWKLFISVFKTKILLFISYYKYVPSYDNLVFNTLLHVENIPQYWVQTILIYSFKFYSISRFYSINILWMFLSTYFMPGILVKVRDIKDFPSS
jgi:hypothetical protein